MSENPNNIDLQKELESKFKELFGERKLKVDDNDEEPYEEMISIEKFIEKNNLSDEQKTALLSIPWGKTETAQVTFEEAERSLNKSHYGLDNVKEKVLELLAVQQRVKRYGKAILLVGPPGVGKTTIAVSLARALGRKIFKKTLGGIIAGWEISGSNPQWKSASYGIVVEAIITTQSMCPVIVLDELDKMGNGGTGHSKPSSAMLSLLDCNRTAYVDEFIKYPINISNVMFIATANNVDDIDPVLLDRFEVIYLKGYTIEEKERILDEYIIPQKCNEYMLTRGKIGIDAVKSIILDECFEEEGVRLLEKCTDEVLRSVVYEMAKRGTAFRLNAEYVKRILKRRIQQTESFHRTSTDIGVVKTFCRYEEAVYPVVVEVVAYSGFGKVTVSGAQDVDQDMIETARVALVNCTEHIKTIDLAHTDFHIRFHCDKKIKVEGVGLAILLAEISAITQRSIKEEYVVLGNVSPSGYGEDTKFITAFIRKAATFSDLKVIIPAICGIDDPGENVANCDSINEVVLLTLKPETHRKKVSIGFVT